VRWKEDDAIVIIVKSRRLMRAAIIEGKRKVGGGDGSLTNKGILICFNIRLPCFSFPSSKRRPQEHYGLMSKICCMSVSSLVRRKVV
jgi:hypothetical protein